MTGRQRAVAVERTECRALVTLRVILGLVENELVYHPNKIREPRARPERDHGMAAILRRIENVDRWAHQ
jgi:hypothetical protein